jgi:hypothetical protein
MEESREFLVSRFSMVDMALPMAEAGKMTMAMSFCVRK